MSTSAPTLRHDRAARSFGAVALNDPDWADGAPCKQHPVGVFFPEDDAGAAHAIAICSTCCVQERCLDIHLHEIDGIFGGLTPMQRVRVARRRGHRGNDMVRRR